MFLPEASQFGASSCKASSSSFKTGIIKRTLSGLEGTKVPYSRGKHFIKSFSLDWIVTVELLGSHFKVTAFSLLPQHFKFEILQLRKI